MRDLLGARTKILALYRDFEDRRVSCVFRNSSLHEGGEFRFDARGRRRGTEHERDGVAHGTKPEWGSEAELRRLLLSPEPPLCSLRDRSLRHVSAGPSRRAAAAQPAAVRVPAGAP